MTESASPSFSADITFLIVPGLRDHIEDHWQTHLQKRFPSSVCVPPLKHDRLSRKARVDALDCTLAGIEGRIILVAHSAGCITTVHWAQNHQRKIHGALLATPADVDVPMPEGYPTLEQLQTNGWSPMPATPLPFPTILAASRNDPLLSYERAVQLAKVWGAYLEDLGNVGHLNPVAGFGPWPGVDALLQKLV
ncbi:RBBP9/YdeN family alpha/beta hydrolase [Comamonas resistens]|uniref:RBBP9/YdeN family alpha/beta hydrolase n=1 Tax=Comamonas resistens TaxID=3046670 RepID=UPI0039BCF0F1